MHFGPFDAEQAPGELARLLDEFGSGAAVMITTVPALLTVTQAADVLGCSRHHVSRLVDTGTLAADFHGLHRRVARSDVLALADRRARVRTEVLDNLAELSRSADLYDEF